MSDSPSWLRRNRWWLLALPVSLALVVASSSYFVKDFWYDAGLHHRLAEGEPGDLVTVTDDYSDALGETSRTFSVRFSETGTWPVYPTQDGVATPPPGLEVRFVRLDFEAETDQALGTCTVVVEDSDGRRYEVPDAFVQIAQCTPADRSGPIVPGIAGQERGELPYEQEPRPPTWSVTPRFLLPEGAEITRVLIWWQLPDYVELAAP
jgi:hypothetical protein